MNKVNAILSNARVCHRGHAVAEIVTLIPVLFEATDIVHIVPVVVLVVFLVRDSFFE